MTTTAKLFRNGASQAVRLPKEFRFRAREVCIKRIGSAVLLFPKGKAWDIMGQAWARWTTTSWPTGTSPSKPRSAAACDAIHAGHRRVHRTPSRPCAGDVRPPAQACTG